MTSPQEYNQILSDLTLKFKLPTINSIQDAQEALTKFQELQSDLWELKKRIKFDVNLVWEKYKNDTKGSFGETIIAGFLGKRTSYKIRKSTRDRLSRERDALLKQYEYIQSAIDDLIRKIKPTINELKTFIRKDKAKNKQSSPGKKQRAYKQNRSTNKSPKFDYYVYIESQEWREKAEEAKAIAGNRCKVCNKSRAEVQLDAHHRTYERLGNELPEDITVLCRDCYQLYEDNKRMPPPPSPQSGFCIRCKVEIKLNPQAPYCYSCYTVWKRFENPAYQEKICHICGKDHESTMIKPACLDCYLEHRHKLEFKSGRGS